MDRLTKKHETLSQAIATFEQALSQYKKWITTVDKDHLESINIDYIKELRKIKEEFLENKVNSNE